MFKKIADLSILLYCLLTCTALFGFGAWGQNPSEEAGLPSADGSLDDLMSQFESGLLLVDRLANEDLTEASKQADSNIELARSLDNENAMAVALIDSALIDGRLNSFDVVPKDLPKAMALYVEEEATATQSIHYNASYIDLMLRNDFEFDTLAENFSNLKKSIDECEDDQLVLSSLAQILFHTRAECSDEFTRDEIARILDSRSKNVEKRVFEAEFARLWIEALAERERCEPKREYLESNSSYESLLDDCLTIADQSRQNYLLMFAHRNIGIHQNHRLSFENAKRSLEDSWRYAEALNDPTESTAAAIHSALNAQQFDDADQAIQLLDKVQQETYFEKSSVDYRQGVYNCALHIYTEKGDKKNSKKYANLIVAPEIIARMKASNSKLIEQGTAAITVEREKLALAEESRRTKSFYQNLLMFTIIGLLGFVMGIGLVISRRRERHMLEQLDRERESAREDAIIRERLENKVSHMQKMESLGMLAGGVAHDFNNLLVGVMCNAEVIKMHTEGKDRFIDERTQQIIRSAEKAADLSRQMLAYAGKQQIEREPADLNQLIKRLGPILNSAGGKTTQLKLSLSPVPVVSEVDATQIEQVLINLVTNARKAIEDRKSQVIIRTGVEAVTNLQEDPNIVGGKYQPGEFAYIEVEDFGCGIPAADLQRIYEPFYSKEKMGRGLGLAVVYGIVDGHEGLIRTDSIVGKGTRIRILLPKSNARVPATPDLEDSDELSSTDLASTERHDETHRSMLGPHELSRNATLLIVDDQKSVLNSTKQMLELDGWRVITTDCGKDAITVLTDPLEEIQGVLLDVVMPEMNGDELLEEMLAKSIDTKVVLMSGYSQTRLDEYLEHPLVVSVVKKPFRLKGILATINRCFGKSSQSLAD